MATAECSLNSITMSKEGLTHRNGENGESILTIKNIPSTWIKNDKITMHIGMQYRQDGELKTVSIPPPVKAGKDKHDDRDYKSIHPTSDKRYVTICRVISPNNHYEVLFTKGKLPKSKSFQNTSDIAPKLFFRVLSEDRSDEICSKPYTFQTKRGRSVKNGTERVGTKRRRINEAMKTLQEDHENLKAAFNLVKNENKKLQDQHDSMSRLINCLMRQSNSRITNTISF